MKVKPNKDISVDERWDGSKACFCVLGPGRPGDVVGGFAFPPQDDLLVLRSPEAADEAPPEQRMRNPVAAAGEFPELFEKIEKFIAGQSH